MFEIRRFGMLFADSLLCVTHSLVKTLKYSIFIRAIILQHLNVNIIELYSKSKQLVVVKV